MTEEVIYDDVALLLNDSIEEERRADDRQNVSPASKVVSAYQSEEKADSGRAASPGEYVSVTTDGCSMRGEYEDEYVSLFVGEPGINGGLAPLIIGASQVDHPSTSPLQVPSGMAVSVPLEQGLSPRLYFLLESVSASPPVASTVTEGSITSSLSEEPIYEPVTIDGSEGTSPAADDGDMAVFQSGDEGGEVWLDEEFETVSAADTLPKCLTGSKSSEGIMMQGETTLLGRLTGRLSFKAPKAFQLTDQFEFDRGKHPLPSLPPRPENLTEKQIKRRYVVESIIAIENSYVNSLIRLKQNYMEPLLRSPQVLNSDKVNSIFCRVNDILDCHLMFQVALEECAKNWDRDERIGGQFVSSFSKSMVLDSYSDYVNNFLAATELIKKAVRERSLFETFLEERQSSSPDRLGILGLMLKPIQRFPQFILQVKDLIKHTPCDHPDHVDLHRALTALENMAHELNEKKRASEEKLAARVVLGKLSVKPASEDSHLIRQDDAQLVEYSADGQVVRKKPRRLLLFNDMLLCVRIDSDNKEKYHLKWSMSIGKVMYHEACKSSSTHVTVNEGAGGVTIVKASLTAEDAANANFERLQRELGDLVHDEAVLHRIYSLTAMLRQPYKGLSTEDVEVHVAGVTRSVALRHEQLKMLHSCTVLLSLPSIAPTARAGTRLKLVFQLLSPEVKQDWVLDFRAAKLSEDVQNKPGWMGDVELLKYPLLIKSLQVDIMRDCMQVYCATPIFLTSTSGGIGLQYLWLCGGKDGVGQVTIVSLHSSQPYVIESFRACETSISGVTLVPSDFHAESDQVWMASGSRVLVYKLRCGQPCSGGAVRTLVAPAAITSIYCSGRFVFLALENGSLMKYSKYRGDSLYTNPCVRKLGISSVSCLVAAGNCKLYCAVNSTIFVVSTQKDMPILESYDLACARSQIQHIVKIGHGIWVSFHNDTRLRLYHVDTYDFLQDVDVDSALHKLLPGSINKKLPVCVTAMAFTQGLLWIGTNTGHVLTVPIPVLQGVPNISGRMNISANGHIGPVSFLVAVKCSLTFAPKLVPDAATESLSPPLLPSPPSSSEGTMSSMRRWSAGDLLTDSFEGSTSREPDLPPRLAELEASKPELPPRNATMKGHTTITSSAAAIRKPFKRSNFFGKAKKPSAKLGHAPLSPRRRQQRGTSVPDLADSFASLSVGADTSTDDLASMVVAAAAAGDSSLRSMYSSLMNLTELDALDNSKAISELVNCLVPINAAAAAERTVTTARVRRSALLQSWQASAGTAGSMFDLRSTNAELARRAHSTWMRNRPAWPLLPAASNLSRGEATAVQGSTDGTNANSSPVADPVYDDVALEHDDGAPPAEPIYQVVQRGGQRGGISTVDEVSLAEELEEELVTEEDDSPATTKSCQALANSEVDQVENAIVETNFLKTILIISGGAGYCNCIQNSCDGQSEDQSEATLLLWQHTQKFMQA